MSDPTLATVLANLGSYPSNSAAIRAALENLVTLVQSNADSPVEAHTPSDLIPFTPTLDTSGAYSIGDVLFATATLSNVARINDGRSILSQLTVIDKAKNKPGITLFFYQTNVTSAAANAANNLSDADAINLLGFHRIQTTDWIDLANNSFACFKGPTAPNLMVEAATGTKDIYVVGIVDATTPTYAAGDLVFKFGWLFLS